MLNRFRFIDLEFSLLFHQPVVIRPETVGPMLRGAFGTQLRRIVCHDTSLECMDCQVRSTCGYEKVFAPVVPPDADRLRKQRDLPRGFVMKPPLTGQNYGPDHPFTFRIILVGDLLQWLPYVILPFSELGRVGIGRERTPYQLNKIISRGNHPGEDAVVYEAETNLVKPGEILSLSYQDLAQKADPLNKRQVTLMFMTPTILRHNPSGRPGESKVARIPEFQVVIKRLRDRVNRLSTLYCGEELDTDYQALGQRAERVMTQQVNGNWIDKTRSTRKGEKQELGGFVGEISYSGDIEEFLPLLLLGEYLHIGKNAVFGNGWYQVSSDSAKRSR